MAAVDHGSAKLAATSVLKSTRQEETRFTTTYSCCPCCGAGKPLAVMMMMELGGTSANAGKFCRMHARRSPILRFTLAPSIGCSCLVTPTLTGATVGFGWYMGRGAAVRRRRPAGAG